MQKASRQIIDRVAADNDIFMLEELGNRKYKLISMAKVTENGTFVNKELMQPWEDMRAAVCCSDEVQLKMLHSGRVVLVTNKGKFSESETYNKHDYAVFEDNGFVAMEDDISGIEPSEDSNAWQPFEW